MKSTHSPSRRISHAAGVFHIAKQYFTHPQGWISLKKAPTKSMLFSGRGRRNRTLNQWFWRPLLYQLSYTPTKISGFLSSQGASPQVLSAFAGLTAVFGMGTGGSPQLSPLNCYVIQDSYPDNCIKMFFLTNSLLVSESSFSLCICFQFHSFLRFGVSDSLSFARRLRLLQNWFSA